MSRRTVWWIVAAAVLVHAGLFLLFGQMKALPQTHRTPAPKANFGYQEQAYDDPKTGERVTFREIRVSTKLADPATLPPTPVPKP